MSPNAGSPERLCQQIADSRQVNGDAVEAQLAVTCRDRRSRSSLVVLDEYRLPKSARPNWADLCCSTKLRITPQANRKWIRQRQLPAPSHPWETMRARAPSKRGILPNWAALTIVGCISVAMGSLWFVILAGGAIAIGLGALAIVIAAACTTTYRRAVTRPRRVETSTCRSARSTANAVPKAAVKLVGSTVGTVLVMLANEQRKASPFRSDLVNGTPQKSARMPCPYRKPKTAD